MGWLNRIAAIARSRKLESDLDEELQLHIELKTQANIAAGMPPEEARYAALRAFGKLEHKKEECRDADHLRWLEDIIQDVRYGLRQLRHNPGFTAVAVLTLALGIGANTAIFSVVNTVLLRPLAFERPSQLLDIWATSAHFDFPHLGSSLPDIADIRKQSSAFVGLAVYRYSFADLTGAGPPRRLQCVQVSHNLFQLLGVRPLLGRLFDQSEMHAGQAHVVILSYELWQSLFGGSPDGIGKSITLENKPYRVVGVMPKLPKINFPTLGQVWVPLAPTKSEIAARGMHFFPVLARLKSGRTIAQAQMELDTIASRLAKTYPKDDGGWSFRAVALRADLFGKTSAPLLVLFAVVGFVLLIACANVANLVLARGSLRRREIAVRLALGATRRRLVRQMVAESILLSLIGGACGLFLALWGIYGLRSLIPADIPRIEDLNIGWVVLWFTFGISIISGLLAGLVPAWLASGQDLSVAMKQNGAGSNTESRSVSYSLREMLVVFEIALAVALVIGAGLALRSFAQLRSVDLGFEPLHVLTMYLDFPPYRFKTPQTSVHYVQRIIASLHTVPGVSSVSATNFAPMSGWEGEGTLQIEGAPPAPAGKNPTVGVEGVAPNYFQALGIPLLAGRDFTREDNMNSPPVVIVNQALAKKYFVRKNPIGERVLVGSGIKGAKIWGTIIGEVGSMREQKPQSAPKPELYRALYQGESLPGTCLIIRARGNPVAIAPAVRDRIRSLDREQVVTAILPMDRLVEQSIASARFQTFLLALFGGLSLLLALVGIYGVISYSVTQSTHEIGIRMALGAEKGDVLRMVVGQGFKLAFLGVGIGILGALALTRFLSSLLYGVKPTDPLTFIAVSLILVAVALLACYIPARRAAKVDPMVALRHE